MTQSIHQVPLSNLPLETETTPQPGCFPNPTSSSVNESVDQGTSRKKAHCLVEKRYRKSLTLKFQQLEVVTSHRRGSQDMGIMPDKLPLRRKRAAILEDARCQLLELQAEVKALKERLGALVETVFPDTCKFVLPDD